MPLQIVPIPIGGSLNLSDAPGQRPAGEVAQMLNLRPIGSARVAARRAATDLLTGLTGDVVGVFRFPFFKNGTPEIGAIQAVWDDATGAVALYKVGPDAVLGAALTDLPASWTSGVAERPQVSGAVLGTRLFLAGRAGSHRMVLCYYDAADDVVYTPEFDFDGDYVASPASGDEAAMEPRSLAVYNNILFAVGYGTEVEKDRPEMARFSYLGLNFDPVGQGDAGLSQDAVPAEITPGSSNLFDREDYFMVGERGQPVLAMGSAGGRLLFLAYSGVYHLFGYSRDDFQLEQLDTVRGIGAAASLVLANGTAYWWSPLVGPVVYTGSGVQELGDRIRDRIPSIAADQVVGAHAPADHEVRFYYPDPSGTGSRSLAYDYRLGTWSEGTHPFPVYCAGEIAQQSTNVTLGLLGKSSTTPLVAPSALTVESETVFGATVSWTNGETGVGAETDVFLAGVFVTTVDVNGAASSSYTFAGLQSATTYPWSVQHRVGERTSTVVDATLTTDAEETTPSAPPFALLATSSRGGVNLSWKTGETGRYTQIERKLQTDPSWPGGPLTVLEPGVTSYRDIDVEVGTVYDYRARHAGAVPGVESTYSNTAIITVSPLAAGVPRGLIGGQEFGS